MEAFSSPEHSEPQQGSLIDEPEFIELCRLARRLPEPQRDKLHDLLFNDVCERIASEYEHTLRIFNDGLDPLRLPQESD